MKGQLRIRISVGPCLRIISGASSYLGAIINGSSNFNRFPPIVLSRLEHKLGDKTRKQSKSTPLFEFLLFYLVSEDCVIGVVQQSFELRFLI